MRVFLFLLAAAVLTGAVRITRFPEATLKRQGVSLTAVDAAAANLSWVVRIECPLPWASVSDAAVALDASAVIHDATNGAVGVPCALSFVAQATQETILVVTCQTDDAATGDRITALLNSTAVALLGGDCAASLVVTRDQVVRNASSITTQTISNAGLWNLDRYSVENVYAQYV